jgi:hypothetical protein
MGALLRSKSPCVNLWLGVRSDHRPPLLNVKLLSDVTLMAKEICRGPAGQIWSQVVRNSLQVRLPSGDEYAVGHTIVVR